ncbi:hypothetical protein EAH89_09205 [Roseomonas nepalensis]|uniref:Uncharacterized protein n=2 Tax=Muricoccus nepalensis TaxID=1854500 RepID=A0A502G8A0_9PROT|nr:hypothetical protein EAH89_09205 [Roseomonas nepalensis]
MIERKRELDQMMCVYGPLFDKAVFDQYNAFIHSCFRTFNGVGRDACLRADLTRLQETWGTQWNSEWNGFFVDAKQKATNQEIARGYNNLLHLLALEIGIRAQPSDDSKPKLRNRLRTIFKQ